jgi:hypothetical protein
MTTAVRSPAVFSDEAINMKFLEMMPTITKSALLAFANYTPDKRAEAVQNILCWAFLNLKNLAASGKLHDAHSRPIAKFAIGRHHEGRAFGTVTSSTDVMSSYCRSLGRVHTVKHYGICENVADTYEGDASAMDARYPPDRVVQFKMDFYEGWLQQQSPKDREIIRELAMGSTQSEVARKFGVTPACINQYQKRYRASWNAYIADKKEAAKKAA